jgi:GWxTD domain-containing protein
MRPRVLLVTLATAAVAVPALIAQQRETVARPMSEREKQRQEERLRKELETPYKKWLDEEVRWIITDEERKAFSRLETDDERQNFIEQFWLRRDPSPDTEENEYREEHYRRIAWANDRFASGIPGWKTDRGMIYIKFGPPDEREEHPTGGTYNRPIEEGGGQTTVFPFEKWRYRYIEGVGQDVIIEFVDKSMTNEYRMTWDPSEKDALLRVPGAGLTLYEQMGLADKADRFTNQTGMMLGAGPLSGTAQMNVFDRIQRYVAVQKAPEIKFKDLEAAVSSSIRYDLLPMRVRADFIPVTENNVYASITVQFNQSDLQFRQKDGMAEAVVNLYGTITTMTRRVISRFEDIVTVPPIPAESIGQVAGRSSVYHKMLSLAPGRYRLSIGAKDEIGGNMSTYEMALDVPRFQEDRLQTSSLILADVLERVPIRSIGQGPFIIGATKVRPRVTETFKRDETMGIYMKVYNMEPNEGTNKTEGTVTYEIIRNGTNAKVFEYTEDVNALGGGVQFVIEKRLPLAQLGLEPGEYTLQIKVTDALRNETLTPSAKFTVN